MAASQQQNAPRQSRRAGAFVLLLAGLAIAIGGAFFTDSAAPLPDPLRPVTGLDWWFSPIERNAFMRLPVIEGAVYGIHALDANTIRAVGENGLIVGTTDGGRTWRFGEILADAPASPPPPQGPARARTEWNLIRSAHAAAEKAPEYPNAAQESPVQQQAPDSPVQQPEEPPPPEPTDVRRVRLEGVVSLDSRTAVAVGHSGTILRTTDSGATWRSVNSGTDRSLMDVTRTSAGRLVAAGIGPTFLTSDDAGVTWTPREVTQSGNAVRRVAFFDASSGFAVESQGGVWITRDGGATWESSRVASGSLNGVAFPGGSLILAAGSGMFRSADGGETWKAYAVSNYYTSTAFVDAKRGLAFGTRTEVTEDGGETWNEIKVPFDPSRWMATSVADGTVYVAANTGGIFRSSDLGRTWSVVAMDSRSMFTRFSFADANRGLLVGGRGTILATSDGGETWTARDSGVTATLNAVDFATAQRAVAVGAGGTLLITTDGGNSWSPREGLSGNVRDVDFATEQFGVAVNGTFGYSRTQDGGETWSSGELVKGERPFGVALVNARRGFLLLGPCAWAKITDDASGSASFGLPSCEGTFPVEIGRARFYAGVAGPDQVSTEAGVSLEAVEGDGALPYFPATPTWKRANAASFADEKHGVAVGTDGLVLSTDDGVKWTQRDSGTSLDLRDVHFLTPTHAAALSAGRVFVSDDAGASWRQVEYQRYPSPWIWIAVLILIAGAALSVRQRMKAPDMQEQRHSVTDAAISDRPLEWRDPDAGGLGDIALGLSRFIRNRRTEPPLTIAVTGEWGTGKSSLMNLLRSDLQRYGFRPVWFNAWHHQSGENLLGSLLANIHAQGVPPWFTVAGMDYRATLLLVRMRRFWFRLSVTLFLISLLFFGYDTFGKSVGSLWSALRNPGNTPLNDLGAAGGLLGLTVAVLTPLIGALRAVSAFGLQPGKLIAAVATTGQDETARLQAGARYRFAREFADFSSALDPRTLVIFIDDLDRCRPPNVIEVLEAVNFLVSSGRCVVVLGMARGWVEACVGEAFKELAAANADEPNTPPARAPRIAPNAATRNEQRPLEQRQFARNYLEKLINIEIRVPRLSDSASRAILQGSGRIPPVPGYRRSLGKALRQIAPLAAVLAVVLTVVLAGKFAARSLADANAALEPPAQTATTAAPNASPVTPAAPSGPSGGATPAIPTAESDTPSYDAPRSQPNTLWYAGTGALLLGTIVTLLIVALFARKEVRTDDSVDFRDALAILQPWIVLGGGSPRSLKRFVNHLRYLAMRFRTSSDPPSLWERMQSRIAAWFDGAHPAPLELPSRTALEEAVLVALAAIYRCNERWLDELSPLQATHIATLLERDFGDRIPDPQERSQVAARLEKSLRNFNARFPGTPLYEDEMLNRRFVVAFFDVMARESDTRDEPASDETNAPTQLRPSRTPAA